MGDASRSLAAETAGTALLLATVIGSGIMGEQLAGQSAALVLLGNTLATASMLVVLVTLFGPISGAHLNPAVTLVFALRGELSRSRALQYVAAQLVGALVGVIAAHAMFGMPAVQIATRLRSGPGQWLSETIATFGLVGVILGVRSSRPHALPLAIGLYIAAAYWFTASTSFANPAVALARSISDTFAGVAPASVPAFVIAELIGALAASVFFGWMFRSVRVPAAN